MKFFVQDSVDCDRACEHDSRNDDIRIPSETEDRGCKLGECLGRCTCETNLQEAGKVCCCARLTNKSARSKASCPAAFWATAGQADPAQSFPSLCCNSKKSVMVYTNTTATAGDMESHAEVAASSLEKAKTSSDPITVLQPFAHQVGGHTQLLVLDHSTLCKPLIQRELHFYLNAPREMRNFIPLYKGVVQVQQIDNSPTIYHPVRGSNKNYGDCEDKLNRTQRHKTSPELRAVP